MVVRGGGQVTGLLDGPTHDRRYVGPIQSRGCSSYAVKGEGMRVMRVKVMEGIRVMVKVKKVTKARKSFVIKICFNIRRLKDAVEVSNNYGEMVAGLIQRRRRDSASRRPRRTLSLPEGR